MTDDTSQLWLLMTKFFSLQHDLNDLVTERESLFRAPLDFSRIKTYFRDLEAMTRSLRNALQEVERLAPLNSVLWKKLEQEKFEGTINQTYRVLQDVSERNR